MTVNSKDAVMSPKWYKHYRTTKEWITVSLAILKHTWVSLGVGI